MAVLCINNMFNVSLQVGFHSGNNESVYNLDVSGTDAVIDVKSTSNVNKPGVWVFKISGPTIDDLGCFSSSKFDTYYMY